MAEVTLGELAMDAFYEQRIAETWERVAEAVATTVETRIASWLATRAGEYRADESSWAEALEYAATSVRSGTWRKEKTP